MTRRRGRTWGVLVGLLLLGAACSEDTSVGEGVNLNLKDQAQGRLRLGETTTTTAAETAVAGPGEGAKAALGATSTTAAPVQTTTTTARQIALTISINSDESALTQFDPAAARVFVGSLVEFVNRDSVTRSVVADTGVFDSGPIAPNGSWVYEATTAGNFNYHDGTRPYAVATIEVVAR